MSKSVRIALLCARLGTAAILIVAALAKLRDPQALAQDIANYRVLPAALVPAAATALPGVELVLGAALALGWWTRAAGVAATALLGVFTIAIGTALLRGIDIECGCFGGQGHPATWWTFARDVGFALAAACVAWRAPA
jgi:putative oxidoreductase